MNPGMITITAIIRMKNSKHLRSHIEFNLLIIRLVCLEDINLTHHS